MHGRISAVNRVPLGGRTFLYAAFGLLLGVTLTVAGYLIDYHALYGEWPSSLTPGLVRALHDVTPVHYFADLFALILALIGGIVGRLQDRVIFYSRRLEEQVEVRTRDLRTSEQRYALAADGANDGIWDWNLATDEVYYAPRWKHMIGVDDRQIDSGPESWLGRVHPDDVERVREKIGAHIEGKTPHLQVDYRMRHADGSYRWMVARGVAVRDEDGRPVRMAGSQTDVHDRRRAEDRIRDLATYDPLTKLPNRTLLRDRIDRALQRAVGGRGKVAILHAGVDRFKKINESLGHEVGDWLLSEVGERLSGAVAEFEMDAASDRGHQAPTGSVFRFDGDEFVVLLEDVRTRRDATRLADRILRAHEGPIGVGGREILINVSIGIAIESPGHREGGEILRAAQTAMHRAKERGRVRFEVFDRDMLGPVEESLHLETELYQALESRHLRLWYQPVVALATGSVVGFEGLVRWEHPERGVISPGRFIPLAEETGLIVKLSQYLFEQAFRRLRQWQDRFTDRQSLSINMNLSPKYLFHPDLESDFVELLEQTRADPSRIHLEITETSFIDDPRAVAEVLERLKDKGFRIALDDFGTGFSSLSMLHELPFDILKIDQRFVSQMGEEPDVEQIVRTIVALARKLELDLVAEGIETEEQLKTLRSMRCKFGQGYLLGRPMTVDDAEALLSTASRPRRKARVRS